MTGRLFFAYAAAAGMPVTENEWPMTATAPAVFIASATRRASVESRLSSATSSSSGRRRLPICTPPRALISSTAMRTPRSRSVAMNATGAGDSVPAKPMRTASAAAVPGGLMRFMLTWPRRSVLSSSVASGGDGCLGDHSRL